MRKWMYGVALSAAVLVAGACSGNKKGDKARIEYDTLPATQITVAVEHYFDGVFFCGGDSAVLTEAATGMDWYVSQDGVYAEVAAAYDSLPAADKNVLGSYYGVFLPKQPGANGPGTQLRLTRFMGFDKEKEGKLLIGTYQADNESLLLRADHTYRLVSGSRETEGKWYLTTSDVLVMSTGEKHVLLDVDIAHRKLTMRGGKAVVYQMSAPTA